jgi:hypothetical protein
MKTKINILLFIYSIMFISLFAQEPESFFPHNVGDKWNYIYSTGYDSYLQQKVLYKDSIGEDGSHYLFYNQYDLCEYKIDTALNVFYYPERINFLLYNLDANIGEFWKTGASGPMSWGWLASIESMYVFSRISIVNKYRYGRTLPDSANSPFGSEEWLASGFGIIYGEGETEFMYLEGCVIAGDTFGYFTSVEDLEKEIPSDFELKQNYPNPFNLITTIEFSLPHEAEVKISIYDILGREVSILYNGRAAAGSHKIKWDAAGFASGIYFCRVQANGYVWVIKMLLMS